MNTQSCGLDFTHIDSTVRIQDDLFRHFNGGWLKSAEIPADRSSDGALEKLIELTKKQVREIIESAVGSEEARKISDLYNAFMDSASVEAKAHSPIQEDLTRIDSIHTLADFISTMSTLEARGLGGLFGSYIYADEMDPTQNILYLTQGGISLPNESYYREEQYADIRSAFLVHVSAMFNLVGIAAGDDLAIKILALETQIASYHFDSVKDRDVTLTYNKMSRAQIVELMPAFDFDLYISASEIPSVVFDCVIFRQPDFFAGLSTILSSYDRDTWVAWLKWRIITGSAPYLSSDLVNQNFEFYGTTLTGTPILRERWKRAVSMVEGSLGEAVGKTYVEQHFPRQAKERMEQLVAHLTEAYRISINELEWMSSETKVKALEKLSKFTHKIGYPDKWRDYNALEITPDDLFENISRTTKFARDFEFAKIGKPVDRDDWHMTPQTVNAFYNPVMNEIVFPAAFLQPPFFGLNADDAVNYGGIGAIIGHEIGHGFDDQGSKYDGDGALNNWWSDTDRAAFERRANALIEQYNTLRPKETPEITVNGALTVGENIGDLGGLTIAYKAYQISLDGKPSTVIDGLTGEARFFLAWAQAWRSKVRPEEQRRWIAIDPHSPNEFRCNTIASNFTPFYEAFDVNADDGMWIEESQRVAIW